MKEAVVAIVGAVFNIAAIIANAFGFEKVAETLSLIGPEVNIIVVALLFLFGYTVKRRIVKKSGCKLWQKNCLGFSKS